MEALANGPLDGVDEEILRRLRLVHESRDPVPADLADRSAFAVTVAALEAEVAELTAIDTVGAALRGEAVNRADTISFSGADLTTMVTIEDAENGHRRICGWASDSPLVVELRRSSHSITTATDGDGRYIFEDVEPGLVHLLLRRAATSAGVPLATPLFEI